MLSVTQLPHLSGQHHDCRRSGHSATARRSSPRTAQHNLPVPWDDFDVLFIGGSTAWKLGSHMRRLATVANRRGMYLHMGRVNSLRRYRYAEAIGCDSVDGTYLTFGPNINLPRLLWWLRDLEERPALFGIETA